MQHLEAGTTRQFDAERLEGSTTDKRPQIALESIGLHGGNMPQPGESGQTQRNVACETLNSTRLLVAGVARWFSR